MQLSLSSSIMSGKLSVCFYKSRQPETELPLLPYMLNYMYI